MQNDGSGALNQPWAAFKAGFSDNLSNYWIGNDNLYRLTKNGKCMARFEGWKTGTVNNWYWAEYSAFIIGGESTSYQIGYGTYNGALAVDGLIRGMQFHTKDRDLGFCADARGGGFWISSNCALTAMTATTGYMTLYGPPGVTLKFSRISIICR